MSFKLMYITNNPEVAQIAQNNSVDWIFVDLEIMGKEDRQGHLDTVISRHTIDDVKNIKKVLFQSKLLVRINPMHKGSRKEIDDVIVSGADIVMLPFFKSEKEVRTFVDMVDKRAEVCLLLETPEAVEHLDDILTVDEIDYVHVGLNDLHLGYRQTFMFELLADGTVEKICSKLRQTGVKYGFGGIAELGQGDLPAEIILKEHHRLGSSMVILSRSFCNSTSTKNLVQIEQDFNRGVSEIREYQKKMAFLNKKQFDKNKQILNKKVEDIKISKEMISYEKSTTYRGI